MITCRVLIASRRGGSGTSNIRSVGEQGVGGARVDTRELHDGGRVQLDETGAQAEVVSGDGLDSKATPSNDFDGFYCWLR
jgi:hypothetical protein